MMNFKSTIKIPNAGKVLSREDLKNVLGGGGTKVGEAVLGCDARAACSSGCATYTDANDTKGYCSTCCIA